MLIERGMLVVFNYYWSNEVCHKEWGLGIVLDHGQALPPKGGIRRFQVKVIHPVDSFVDVCQSDMILPPLAQNCRHDNFTDPFVSRLPEIILAILQRQEVLIREIREIKNRDAEGFKF